MAIQDIATPQPSPTPPRRRSESLNPATGEVWRAYEPASPDEVRRAVARAREAQREWAARPVRERARVLERFRRALYRRRLEVADLISRENGKPAAEALGTEVSVVLDYARFYARKAPGALRGSWFTPASLAMWRKRVRIGYEPYGVVAVVSPWNYPFMLAGGVMLPALVAGNAVVLKPSEFTPTTGMLLGDLAAEAGVPAGVMTVIPGDGATGASLVGADVNKVFFIGSVATGKRVAAACAERLIPCSLELGGSDPAIVLDDADVRHAAAGIAWGRFSNAGQTCVAPKRVFVVDAVYDAFAAELRRVVEGLRVAPAGGAACDVGPLIRPSQA
ncbi:MAG TPA: aldehyde dehydrogenase family protein, partial [Gemmatimonadaceae bacterium]|nr:aldehyde dehydrogenase family protein [Gemmatimonadaceae bacterium]